MKIKRATIWSLFGVPFIGNGETPECPFSLTEKTNEGRSLEERPHNGAASVAPVVNLAPVTDSQSENHQSVILNLADDAIIADAIPPQT